MKNKVVEDSVQRQLLSLAQMDKDELAAKWQKLFGKNPPEYGPVFMRRRLAHKIQELFYGGLSEVIKERMLSQKRTPARNEVHPKSWTQPLRCIFYEERTQNKLSV